MIGRERGQTYGGGRKVSHLTQRAEGLEAHLRKEGEIKARIPPTTEALRSKLHREALRKKFFRKKRRLSKRPKTQDGKRTSVSEKNLKGLETFLSAQPSSTCKSIVGDSIPTSYRRGG